MVIETEQLILRVLTPSDLTALHAVLSDARIMQHYPHPFSYDETAAWIERNIARYAENGFGLWAVVLKENGRVIGDCGITIQPIAAQLLPEIGYHIAREYQNRGYASQAAAACVRYAFEVLHFEKVYSYMKYTNAASRRVAEKAGMTLCAEYEDAVNIKTVVYSVCADELREIEEKK